MVGRSLVRQRKLKLRKDRKKAQKRLFVDVLDGIGGQREKLQPTPSKDYVDRVTMLDDVVRDCTSVSRGYGGIPSATTKHYYASVIFTAMCTRGVSLAILAPCSPWADKLVEHWDYASMTGIVRTLLELRLAFFYLCIEAVSDDEWQCRWNVFNLHDCQSRIRLFTSLEAMNGVDSKESAGFAEQAEELRQRLISNNYFESLSEKQKVKYLKGGSAFLLPLEEIAVMADFGKAEYRFFNQILSSHVHALPMSFYRIGENDRGRGIPSPTEEYYSGLCISLACTLLVRTRDEIQSLFGPLNTNPLTSPNPSE